MTKRHLILYLLIGWASTLTVKAQLESRLFHTSHHLDPDQKGELRLEVDNLNFFVNNEYKGNAIDGYTLPGLWVQPAFTYQPLKNLKMDLGLRMLWFSGAYKYPNAAYADISIWKGEQFQKGAHVIPVLRAQASVWKDKLEVVLGSIYGGSNHKLVTPLYDSELDLTADPESGMQLLFDSPYFDADAWVNWESFIFKEDSHREAFAMGLSSFFKVNPDTSNVHLYFPIQIIGKHRGGEIQSEEGHDASIQSLLNTAAGFGCQWNINHRIVDHIGGEVCCLLYKQLAGTLWDLQGGAACYAGASLRMFRNFHLKVSYVYSNQFVSLLGNPFWGGISECRSDIRIPQSHAFHGTLDYTYNFGLRYALGVRGQTYYHIPVTMYSTEGKEFDTKNTLSFSFGVYLRIYPSLLLKTFK